MAEIHESRRNKSVHHTSLANRMLSAYFPLTVAGIQGVVKRRLDEDLKQSSRLLSNQVITSELVEVNAAGAVLEETHTQLVEESHFIADLILVRCLVQLVWELEKDFN